MKPITIVGAGKIGAGIAKLLHHAGDYQVTLLDSDEQSLQRASQHTDFATARIDVCRLDKLAAQLRDQWAVVSACPYDLSLPIAEAALLSGCNYFDLTEDIETTQAIRQLANKAAKQQVFVPQCGLAPGFIGILANDMARQFDSIDTLKMRVGALPQYPTNKMMYNLTWSTDGLINEYCNPCESLKNGELLQVQPLEGLEQFSLDGQRYEAFNTSGGLGTLCETLKGRVQNLTYKTVRYQGHQYLADFLVNGLELGKREKRKLLKQILEEAIPITRQDVVLIFVSVTGQKHGQFTQISDARKIYDKRLFGEHWSSIQITTAASVCAVIDLHREGRLSARNNLPAQGHFPAQGFVHQEQISLHDFMNNRFGHYYHSDSHALKAPAG